MDGTEEQVGQIPAIRVSRGEKGHEVTDGFAAPATEVQQAAEPEAGFVECWVPDKRLPKTALAFNEVRGYVDLRGTGGDLIEARDIFVERAGQRQQYRIVGELLEPCLHGDKRIVQVGSRAQLLRHQHQYALFESLILGQLQQLEETQRHGAMRSRCRRHGVIKRFQMQHHRCTNECRRPIARGYIGVIDVPLDLAK
ncbi:MAG: hypothetical protein HY654_05960 [Acidobacteria bacterium]|nr:hypothetical protein [Acidobacteriota bacterium]